MTILGTHWPSSSSYKKDAECQSGSLDWKPFLVLFFPFNDRPINDGDNDDDDDDDHEKRKCSSPHFIP
ncbi:hypothetical protein DERF_013494, partial [Dermatophagoides farinae]